MSRRVLSLLVVVGLVGPAYGVRAAQPATPTAIADIARAVQPMLDARARAFRAHDEAAFLATVDSRDAAFVKEQRAFVRNARELPLAAYLLRVKTDDLGNAVTPADIAKWGAGTAVVHVVEEWEVAGGHDTGSRAFEDLFWTLTPGGPLGWRLAADDALDTAGLQSSRHSWEFAPIHVRRSAHFLAVYPDNRAGDVGKVLDEAEQALAQIRPSWTVPWNDRVVMELPRDAASLGRQILATFPLDNFVAFASATIEQRELTLRFSGRRVLIQPENFLGQSASERRKTLAHELIHIASRAIAGPYNASWLEEGIAQVLGENSSAVGLSPMSQAIRAGRFTGHLPADYQFVVGGADRIYQSYVESYLLIREVEKIGGRRATFDLYQAAHDNGRLKPGTSTVHMDRAVRAALGMSLAQLEQRWAADVRANRLR